MKSTCEKLVRRGELLIKLDICNRINNEDFMNKR